MIGFLFLVGFVLFVISGLALNIYKEILYIRMLKNLGTLTKEQLLDKLNNK